MTTLSPAAQAVFAAWAPHSDPYYHDVEVQGLADGLRAASDCVDDSEAQKVLRALAFELDSNLRKEEMGLVVWDATTGCWVRQPDPALEKEAT